MIQQREKERRKAEVERLKYLMEAEQRVEAKKRIQEEELREQARLVNERNAYIKKKVQNERKRKLQKLKKDLKSKNKCAEKRLELIQKKEVCREIWKANIFCCAASRPRTSKMDSAASSKISKKEIS